MRVLSIYHSPLHPKENSSTAEQRLGNGVGVEWGSGEGKMEGVARVARVARGGGDKAFVRNLRTKRGCSLCKGIDFY